MTELAAFARRLRSVRVAYARAIDLPDLSACEFAKLLGVPLASYEAFEAGIQEPPLSTLAILHRRTGVSLDWLIAHQDAPETQRNGREYERPAAAVAGVRR